MKWTREARIEKDPSDVIDVSCNFAPFLGSDTIDTATIVGDGVTVDSSSVSGNTVTIWLSGGGAGTLATVKVTVVTSNATPRTVERTFKVNILDL